MADDATPAQGGDVTTENTEAQVVAQADNPDAVKNALAAERAAKKAAEKRANELAAKVQEFESANQSELEKLTTKATKAEQAKAEAEAKLTRYEVAAAKNVPAEAVDFLKGTTREELEASADRLLELVKSRNDNDSTPDFDGGAREPAPEPKSPEQQHNEEILGLLGLRT